MDDGLRFRSKRMHNHVMKRMLKQTANSSGIKNPQTFA